MKKTAAQLDREIGQFLTGKRRIAHVGFGTYSSSKVNVPSSLWDADRYKPGRAERRDPTLPKGEMFAVRDRHGKLIGKSFNVQGAMQYAPATGNVDVRGEYTSDGQHHGLGRGRLVASRENGRWIVFRP